MLFRSGDGLSSDGWLASARRVPSPNHDARPPKTVISLLVIHAISLPPNQFGGDAIERFFTNTLPATGAPILCHDQWDACFGAFSDSP